MPTTTRQSPVVKRQPPIVNRQSSIVNSLLALALLLPSHAGAQIDADRLAGFKARLIGPAGMSGRVTAIDAVASNPDIIYAGAATGGVWKSTNGGLTWEPLFDDQPVHAVGAVAIYQPNPDIVWVGTGEGNVRNSASVGNGVYRTIDGGKRWQHLGLEKTERIHRIAIHPADPQVAYACALGQEWGENPDRGVFKTSDGGRSWTKVLYVDERTGCGDLVQDPSNPLKLMASMWEFRRWPDFFKSGGPGSGIFVTHDGGASWRKLQQEDGLPKGPLGRAGLAISRSNPEIVYALVEAEKSALVRSEDGGRTWRIRNERPNVVPRPFYFADLRVDPMRPDRIYSLDYEVRVSNDGGRTFETLPGASFSQIHGDHHALWIHPEDPELMLAGNDGGVAVSHDRGRTFRFVGNLPLAQFYHVAVDHDRPYNVYGGLQDNGSWRGPSSVWQRGGIRNHHWHEVGGGDGFETLPDPKDSMQGYALWQGGNLMRWNLRTGEQKSIKPAAPQGARLRFNWNAGLAVDPFDPGTLYLGSQFLHRSTDRGETWSIISPDLTSNNPEWQRQSQSGGLTTDVTAAENHTTIVAIAPSAVEKGVIWVGSDDGRIHVTRDGGKNWSSVEKNVKGVPANTWVPHIEPSRHQASAAFAVFDNHRRSDQKPYVYKTEDFGQTWTSLATDDLAGYGLVVRQDPVQPNLLFLGSEFGLYVSVDGGRRWTHMKKTLPTASVMDLVIHPRDHDLVIGTHGRAVWVLDDIRPLRALSEKSLQAPLTLHEIAPSQQHWLRTDDGGYGFGAGEFRGTNRPYGAIITYSLNLPGLPLADDEKERARKEQERQARAPQPTAKPEAAPREPTPPEREAAEKQKAGEGEKEDRPRVDIVVTDASGRTIRRFKGPATLGVNRTAWDLRHDAFLLPPRAEDAPPLEEEPAGPEMPPGRYTVAVKFGGHEATQTVEIVADPRSKNSAGDWQRRWDAILQAGALNDSAVQTIWRLRRTRDDIGSVQARVRKDAELAGEKDEKKIEQHPLITEGERVKRGLTDLEKRLWVAPEQVGIVADVDAFSQLNYAAGYLLSSWDPPNPTHVEHLKRSEAGLKAVIADIVKYFAGEVAAYRKRVQDSGVGLLGAANR